MAERLTAVERAVRVLSEQFPQEYRSHHGGRLRDAIAAALEAHAAEAKEEGRAEERERCARIAWKMQMEQFGGGTAIGNAIQDTAIRGGEK